MPESRHSKVLILGSGPAGYTAAIYAARANLEPMLISGMEEGGQLSITTDVENYPGFAEVIQGPWLMEQMKGQADHVGTQLITDLIVEVDLDERPFRCKGDSGAVYTGDTLIIATGAQARWLGLPGETKFRGFGVSACATCDGFFYRDKEVAVVGGGNTAVEEALFLTNFASKVSLVHRRDALRAEKILQDRLFQNAKIEVLWDHVLDDVLGTDEPLGVTGVRLRNAKSGDLHGLHPHPARFDRDRGSRRLCRRRCPRQDLSPGRDGGGHGLHGGLGGREVPGRDGVRGGASRSVGRSRERRWQRRHACFKT
jgi:thioredoxin reductase (NADPH)